MTDQESDDLMKMRMLEVGVARGSDLGVDELHIMKLVAEREKLKAENARLREALEWYADEGQWDGLVVNHDRSYSEIEGDDGKRARAALKEPSPD